MSGELLNIIQALLRSNAHKWEDIGKQTCNSRDFNIALNSRIMADQYWSFLHKEPIDYAHKRAQQFVRSQMNNDQSWKYVPNYNQSTDNIIRNSIYYDNNNAWDNQTAHIYDITHEFDGINNIPK